MRVRDQRQEQLRNFGPLFTGKVLRDEGISQVSNHNKPWIELCHSEADRFLNTRDGTFTGEDIRRHCELYVGHPAHPNGWGALMNRLTKRKLINPTGSFVHARNDDAHARMIREYRRLSHCEQPTTATTSKDLEEKH